MRLVQPVQVNKNCVHASVKRTNQHFDNRAIPVCHITYTCFFRDKFTWVKTIALQSFIGRQKSIN